MLKIPKGILNFLVTTRAIANRRSNSRIIFSRSRWLSG